MNSTGFRCRRIVVRTNTELSIILPVRNEEENIGGLLREIVAVVRNNVRMPAEIIVMDDASDDASAAVVQNFVKETGDVSDGGSSAIDPEVKLFRLNVHSGQARALMKGFAAAKGGLFVSMDGDGQYDPADIPRFLEKADTCDLVCGARKGRSDGFARLLCSKAANSFRNLVTGDTLKDAGCTFRLMRKECFPVLKHLPDTLLGCDFFFHPLFVRAAGYRVGEIAVTHRGRKGGRSNYHLLRKRFLRGARACFRAAHLKNRLRRRNVS